MGDPIPPPATRIVGIIAERRAALVLAEAEKAGPLCDLLEIRLDWLEEPVRPGDLFAPAQLPRPAIATCRRASEGGRWKGTEEARLALLAAAGRAGAAYLDVEVGVAAPADRGGAAILRSLHMPDDSREPAAAALARLEAEQGEILKLVLPARDAADALDALRLLNARPPEARPLAAFAFGPMGAFTRLLQPVFGGALVYAASRVGREVRPGIPCLADLERVYRIRRLRKGSAFFGLLGRPLRHSVSPDLVNAALRGLDRDAIYVPVPCEDATRAAQGLLDLGAVGLAFTAPHKWVPIWLAMISEAVAAQAVAGNTVFRRGTSLVAANTDGPAVRRLAREALGTLEGKLALVLGTGGTARAAAVALREERCRVHIMGRNPDKTAAAAATTGALPGLPAEKEVDLLFHATPVGQWPSVPRDPAALLCPGLRAKVRFDAVYNPRETAFLAAAEGKRIRGVDMLVAQAVDQLRNFGLPKPDSEAMLRAAEAALERLERRVVLIGMRGAGKTAVGEALAHATGRPLLDTDRMVEERAAKSVAQIFHSFGEEAFRSLEREAVRRSLRSPGAVVALGGGAAQHLEASQPGVPVVWLRARKETLSARLRDSGRPSLFGRPVEEEVEDLLREREPHYARLATLTVDTDDRRPDEVAADLAERLGL